MIRLSIIICTYKREQYILQACHSLIQQTLDPGKFEIIIVNNNSPDNTEALCKDFIVKNKNLHILKYAVEKKQGLSNARNKGLELAEGEFITYMDDDAVAEKNFAEKIIDAFERNPQYTALGGKVLPIFPGNKDPEWLSPYLNGMVTKVDYGETEGDFKKKYPAGCNMSFRRQVFGELENFNSSLTIRSDDKYMFYKLKKNHKKILYVPSLVVHHHIDAYRLTPEYLKNQSYQIGYGERLRLQKESFYALIFKFLEYCFKCSAAVILGVGFMLRGQFPKAKYIISILFRTFLGFLFIKPKY